MSTLRVFQGRARALFVVAGLLVAAVAPTVLATVTQAAALTERSIELSSSSAQAEDVTYDIKFTAPTAGGGAFVIDFCSNTPLIGEECTAPTGLDLSEATVSTATAGFTVSDLSDNTVVVTGAVAKDTETNVILEGVDNPDAAGPVYARIVTYNTPENAALYESDDLDPGTGIIDDGSLAISITNTIGVSGAVLETMTFCVSGAEPDEDCANITAPTLKLGETTGTITALQPGVISTGNIYTQISTNAVNGAVISLKSNALGCGGLLRAGAPDACNILPALKTGISVGDSKFGVLLGTAAGVGDNATGTIRAYPDSGYNDTTYALNFDEEEETGVTGPFGDFFLDTNNAPVNNQNMQLTFGATVNNNTPAGLYSADMSLIATGRF